MTLKRISRFLSGAMFGALAGASLGLLIAPYSGQATRHRVLDQGQALRDRAVQTADEARAKAEAVQARGRAAIIANAERLARTAEAARRSAQETWQQGASALPADPTAQDPY